TGRTIETNGSITARSTTNSNTSSIFKGNNYEGETVFDVSNDGTFRGKLRANNFFNTFHIIPYAIKNDTGVSGTPKNHDGSDAIGVTVLNTEDSCLYIHMGSGEWKKIDLI